MNVLGIERHYCARPKNCPTSFWTFIFLTDGTISIKRLQPLKLVVRMYQFFEDIQKHECVIIYIDVGCLGHTDMFHLVECSESDGTLKDS